MSFDPLSLFTPSPSVEHEDPVFLHKEEKLVEAVDSSDSPIDVHDLPLLQLHPPQVVLEVLLQLLSMDEVLNFGTVSSSAFTDPQRVFQDKGISQTAAEEAAAWLQKHNARFHTIDELAHIPLLSGSLKQLPGYNGWLTRIVASDLSWVSSPTSIHKLASLRLAENCGRTAQPEMVRRITLPKLEELTSRQFIRLKEPALTSDNLGLKTWGLALILANRLMRAPELLTSPVLELGSGTGLVGIVASLLGHDVTLTDLNEIVGNLQHNTELNELDVDVCELDWLDPTSFIATHGDQRFSTIVVSDPIYSDEHPAWVVAMFDRFLAPGGRVLLQIPLRRSFERERDIMWCLLDKHGYTATLDEVEYGSDDFGDTAYSFKLLSKPPSD